MQRDGRQLHHDPAALEKLLADVHFAGLWLPIRLYLGWEWLGSGWSKLESPAWMQAGVAVSVDETEPWMGQGAGWYQALVTFALGSAGIEDIARFIAITETLIGIALLLGLLTGIAAATGLLLSANGLLVGATLANPLVFSLGLLVVLAWKTAGWFGLDRWLLPALGAPWQGGLLFGKQQHLPSHSGELAELPK